MKLYGNYMQDVNNFLIKSYNRKKIKYKQYKTRRFIWKICGKHLGKKQCNKRFTDFRNRICLTCRDIASDAHPF